MITSARFGSDRAGLENVGYRAWTIADGLSSRVTSGVIEVGGNLVPPLGEYLAVIPDDFIGKIYWDSGELDQEGNPDAVYVTETFNAGSGGVSGDVAAIADAVIDELYLRAGATADEIVVPLVLEAPGANQIIGTLITRDAFGAPISNVAVYVQLKSAPESSAGNSYQTAPVKIVSADVTQDGDTFVGVVQHLFLRGGKYRALARAILPTSCEADWVDFDVPLDGENFEMPVILGSAFKPIL